MGWIYSDTVAGIGFILCIAAGIASLLDVPDLALALLAFGVGALMVFVWANYANLSR